MSRQIDLTKQLSDEDRKYLEDRDLQSQLDQNAAYLLGGGVDSDEAEAIENSEPPEPYEGVTVSDLKAAIEARNAERVDADKIEVEAPGNRPELVAALVADDAKTEATPEA